MAEYSGITNKFSNAVALPFSSFDFGSGVLDLAYSADDLRRMNDMFWLDGVRSDSGDWNNADGAVQWINGFNIVVQPFRAHVNGTIVFSEQIFLVIEQEAVSSRIDSIVIRRDYIARTATVMVVKGVSGSGTAPTLQNNDGGITDLELARVTVRNDMMMLAQSDISDMRVPLLADFGVQPKVGDAGRLVQVGAIGSLALSPNYKITVDLSSEVAAQLSDTVAVKPGVTGTLPIAHGGTGANTESGVAANLRKIVNGLEWGSATSILVTAAGVNPDYDGWLVGSALRSAEQVLIIYINNVEVAHEVSDYADIQIPVTTQDKIRVNSGSNILSLVPYAR